MYRSCFPAEVISSSHHGFEKHQCKDNLILTGKSKRLGDGWQGVAEKIDMDWIPYQKKI